jgi:hypothetical protein
MLGWCAVINYGILLIWFLLFILARDPLYKLHNKFFGITVEHFNALNYGGISIFKIAIMIFNITPYLALRIAA